MKSLDKRPVIKKGETILTEKPFVYILNSKFRNERCDYCLESGKLLKCSGCQYVMFCGRSCQKSAWKDHKPECLSMKKVAPKVIPDAARILGRIIHKLKNGGFQEKSFYTKTKFRMFRDLMSHYAEIKEDSKRIEHFISLNAVLQEFLGDVMIPNNVELMGMYGKLVVNGFNILDPEMSTIGTGIYLGCSVMNHSCEPTAIAVFEGTTISIRALVDFPEFEWSQVLISYVDLMNSTQWRQEELMQTYYFLCDCNRCKGISEDKFENAMVCPRTGCGTPILVSREEISENSFSLSCPLCTENITTDRCTTFFEVFDFVQMHLENMKDVAYLDVCKVCLKKQENLFYDLNLSRVKVLDLAFDSCIQLQRWEDANSYGPQLIPGYRKYYGENHPLLGILYLKLGKINNFLGKVKEAYEYLKCSEKILQITHGFGHTLYRQEFLPLMMELRFSLKNS
uniref:MYND-type domain-containing protein n=1 Tax=Clastoptera arizonana TaxID=38151 RepID=A0A1B6DNR1_9HEMI